ncbi:MAG: hypothetical protein NVSMB2_06250 [Chloroflexota bacterium]
MKALILAAGEGTRLGTLTRDRPKPMLPVGGAPILEHLVLFAREHGIAEIAINLHYKPQAIVDHFGDGSRFGVSITYSYEESLLGSAGAARKLDWFLDETFVVLYGDVLTDLNLTRLARHHHDAGAAVTLALYSVEDPSRCGMVATDPSGRIESFIEKPARGVADHLLANAGIYVAEPPILNDVPRGQAYDFGSDLFPDLLAKRVPLHAYAADGYVLDIGAPERYAQAEADVQAGRYRRPAAPALAGVAQTC